MHADELRAITHRFYSEVFNQGKLEVIDELFADDFVEHEKLPEMPTDKEAPRAFIGAMREAFPDVHVTVEDMVVENNTVAVRSRMSGTHKGEFMGIPPTGNKIDIEAMDVIRYRNGKVCAHWGVTDSMTMLHQLGVIGEDQPA